MFRYPGQEAVAVKVGTRPIKAKILATGESLQVDYQPDSGKLTLRGLPALPQNPHCTVVEVEFEDIPRLKVEDDLADWLM